MIPVFHVCPPRLDSTMSWILVDLQSISILISTLAGSTPYPCLSRLFNRERFILSRQVEIIFTILITSFYIFVIRLYICDPFAITGITNSSKILK